MTDMNILTYDELIKMYEGQPLYVDTPNGQKTAGYIKDVKIEGHKLIGKVVFDETFKESLEKNLD